ncbi:hypothetical protein [Acuticoccus sp. I52.16.1]|uniref:hypothetical protein n=1 Tax=Acuticoccus sp. I52.16.1 TaxID=2928472 RepID=UPI001FD12280|nr:hypothetical protein [Acuticoccus sp. I52.16.1]UOM34194.1 hypothetical protein MRB58_20580 [Acuticoccus sp. I52.16.1]
MAQRHVVVVPPPGIDGSRPIKTLVDLLRQRGCETTVANLEHADAAPHGAQVVFLYRGLEAVVIEAMTRGAQPSGPIGPWVKEATSILQAKAARGAGTTLVDVADLELNSGAIVDRLVAAEQDNGPARGRRVATGDPVLRALARTAVAEMPKARKLNQDLVAGSLLAPADAAPQADTAFLYYTGILHRRDPAAAELAASALGDVSAERDRLRAETASLRAALAGRTGHAESTTISLGPTFSHPAFYDLERGASGRLFRWMGRRSEATIPVPVAANEGVKVVVTFELVIDGEALAGFEIGVGGRYAQRYETRALPNGQLTKSAVFTALPADEDMVAVTLRQGHAVDRTDAGDPRTLGCGIAAITLVPVPAAANAGKVPTPAGPEDILPGDPEPAPVPPPARGAPGLPAATAGAGGHSLATIVIPVDTAFDEAAFHPVERRPDGLAFAWLGRREEQAFTVTVPLDRPVRVEAHLAMVIDDEAVAGLEIEFDHESPAATEVTTVDDMLVKVAVFDPVEPSGTAAEPVQVLLRARHRVDVSDHGDSRVLAVGLHKLVVRQV